jgi:hypothetical protein
MGLEKLVLGGRDSGLDGSAPCSATGAILALRHGLRANLPTGSPAILHLVPTGTSLLYLLQAQHFHHHNRINNQCLIPRLAKQGAGANVFVRQGRRSLSKPRP